MTWRRQNLGNMETMSSKKYGGKDHFRRVTDSARAEGPKGQKRENLVLLWKEFGKRGPLTSRESKQRPKAFAQTYPVVLEQIPRAEIKEVKLGEWVFLRGVDIQGFELKKKSQGGFVKKGEERINGGRGFVTLGGGGRGALLWICDNNVTNKGKNRTGWKGLLKPNFPHANKELNLPEGRPAEKEENCIHRNVNHFISDLQLMGRKCIEKNP